MKFYPLLCALFALNAFAENTAEMKEIVVALKPDKNPEAMLQERTALENYLKQAMGKPVKVVIPMSGSVIQEGMRNGSIDLAFVSGLEMIQLEKAGAAELALAVEIDGKSSYQSYWVTLKEKPYKSVKDLKDKPIAFASRTSTSGYLIPTHDLIRKKLLEKNSSPESFFGKDHVSFGTGYVSAIERVFNGSAEAAAVSDYVILKDKHLTAEQKAKLKVLAKQGPVPTHILAVRSSLAASDKKKLEKALLAMNAQSDLRDKLFTAKIIKTTSKKHLANLKDALEQTGISL